MRFYTTLFALAATAVTFAAAARTSFPNDHLAITDMYHILLLYVAEQLYKRGGPEICTANKDGSGEADAQVTKDCCAAVNHKAYFNEVEKVCEGYGGPLDNA